MVGIVGANGAGKTTLLKIVTGQEKADSGSLRLGDTVKIAYADQLREGLDPDKSVWEQLSGGLDLMKLGGSREVSSRAYCAWFNFSGSDQQKKVGILSGGERNRLNLAMMVKEGSNLLLLDEPTNDLDVNTMRALEEALDDFAGAAPGRLPRPLVPRPRVHPHPSPSRATARSSGTTAIGRSTPSGAARNSAPTPIARTVSYIGSSRGRTEER